MEIEIYEEGLEVESVDILDVKRKIEEIVDKFIAEIRKMGLVFCADECIDVVEEQVDTMGEEAPDWVKMTAVATEAFKLYDITKPFDMIFGRNVICSGANVTCTDGEKITYSVDRAPAFSPEDFRRRYGHYPRIWKEVYKGGTLIDKEVVLLQDRIGRAAGIFGWDKYKRLVAAALASFKHNFEQTLMAFAKYATMPLRKLWALPNIIPSIDEIEKRRWHAKIMEPPTFSPPAVLRYRTHFPWLNRVILRIGLHNPSEKSANIGVEVWKYDKSDRARIKDIEIPPGNSELRITMWCPLLSFWKRIDISHGYAVIDPVRADKGLAVIYATTEPSPVYTVNPQENMYKGLSI